MDEKITQWEATKYGQLIERTDIEIKGIAIITTKIYIYKSKYYQELWNSGYCVHFSEVID